MKGRGVVLDFETCDPYLSRNLGPGWVYKVHNTESPFRVIGYSAISLFEKSGQSDASYFSLDNELRLVALDTLNSLVTNCDYIICHNAPYDLGCLRSLGIDITKLRVFDTKVMALLYDNTLENTSLGPLSKKFLPSEAQKEGFQLLDAVGDLVRKGIAPFKAEQVCADLSGISPALKSKMTKWAYQHMDVIQEYEYEFMERYATQDAVATAELFKLFLSEVGEAQAAYYSNFQLIFTKMRERGVRIDEEKVKEGINLLRPRAQVLWDEIVKMAGREFNLDSGKQLGEVLTSLGANLPTTDAGRYKTDKKTLETVSHPIIALIKEYKEVNYICSNHFEKICEIIKETGGYVYPEFNLLGAVTGRSSSSHPNIMGIPKRHPIYGALVRGYYIPSDPNNQWIKLDWSNQEVRLAIHDASLINAPGSAEIISEFLRNPKFDPHQRVADMAQITRSQAKTINLGLMYGMGSAKLAVSLGLPQVWSRKYGQAQLIGGPEALDLITRYYDAAPWLKSLKDQATSSHQRYGYIKTQGGRKLRRVKYFDSKGKPQFDDYKALNKRIQGSASDQCLEALRLADEAGLNVKFPVHDEINLEGDMSDALKMQEIMQRNNYAIPMIAEIEIGANWGGVKKVEVPQCPKIL